MQPDGAPGAVQVDRLGVRYGRGDWVLRDLTLTLPFGRLAAVVGPNGSGKSTLLRVLAGVQRANAGRIVGRPAEVAYVPERIDPPPLPVGVWLAHMARLRRAPGEVAASLRALAMAAPLDAPLSTLSKGTWRKVLLAEALSSECRLVVLDEPWADLDLDAAGVLSAGVQARARAGALVVVSDHTGEARGVADLVLAPSGERTDGAVEVRYRGDAGAIEALDDAARSLGFRRVGA